MRQISLKNKDLITTYILRTACVVLACITLYTPSHAQTMNDGGSGGLIAQNALMLRFSHKNDAPRNLIHLQIMIASPVSGCSIIDPITISPAIRGRTLYLDVSLPKARADTSVRNPHYACNTTTKIPMNEIALNRDALIESDVNMLTIKTPGGSQQFTMTVNENMISLRLRNNAAFDILEHWTLPESTVVMSIPMATGDIRQDSPYLIKQLNALSKTHNLIPITKDIPGFIPSKRGRNRFYFLDKSGDFLKTLSGTEPKKIGSIESRQRFYGPKGPYDRIKPLEVYAQHPTEID